MGLRLGIGTGDASAAPQLEAEPEVLAGPIRGATVSPGLRRSASGFAWLADHPRISASTPTFVRKVGGAYYDNLCGLGQTPNNTEMNFSPVSFHGFCVLMKPSDFLSVATPLGQERKEGQLEAFLAAFRDPRDPVGMASPILHLDAEVLKQDPATTQAAKVRGHEGRHRMMALREINGDRPTPVQVRVGDLRGIKDLSAFFCRLAEGFTSEVGGRMIHAPICGLVDETPVNDLNLLMPWR